MHICLVFDFSELNFFLISLFLTFFSGKTIDLSCREEVLVSDNEADERVRQRRTPTSSSSAADPSVSALRPTPVKFFNSEVSLDPNFVIA